MFTSSGQSSREAKAFTPRTETTLPIFEELGSLRIFSIVYLL